MVHVVVGSTRKQEMVCCVSDGDDGSGCTGLDNVFFAGQCVGATDSACVDFVVQNTWQDQEDNFDLMTRRDPLVVRDSFFLDPTFAEIKATTREEAQKDPVASI